MAENLPVEVIHARASFDLMGVALFALSGNNIAEDLIWAPRAIGTIITRPTCVVDKTGAQILMDDLWNVGIRPTEGSGSAGSLHATENHLNDMRKIVSKILKVAFNH
jgi:hypothetical protein